MPPKRTAAVEIATAKMASPLGPITLLAEMESLCGLYLPSQAASVQSMVAVATPRSLSIFDQTCEFLDAYFSRTPLPKMPRMKLLGTPFQVLVWEELQKIALGQTRTYGEIAYAIGRPTASRAVGKAIGDNPISLLVPCHRVIGRSGALTGYAGGLDSKRWLLGHEGVLLGA